MSCYQKSPQKFESEPAKKPPDDASQTIPVLIQRTTSNSKSFANVNSYNNKCQSWASNYLQSIGLSYDKTISKRKLKMYSSQDNLNNFPTQESTVTTDADVNFPYNNICNAKSAAHENDASFANYSMSHIAPITQIQSASTYANPYVNDNNNYYLNQTKKYVGNSEFPIIYYDSVTTANTVVDVNLPTTYSNAFDQSMNDIRNNIYYNSNETTHLVGVNLPVTNSDTHFNQQEEETRPKFIKTKYVDEQEPVYIPTKKAKIDNVYEITKNQIKKAKVVSKYEKAKYVTSITKPISYNTEKKLSKKNINKDDSSHKVRKSETESLKYSKYTKDSDETSKSSKKPKLMKSPRRNIPENNDLRDKLSRKLYKNENISKYKGREHEKSKKKSPDVSSDNLIITIKNNISQIEKSPEKTIEKIKNKNEPSKKINLVINIVYQKPTSQSESEKSDSDDHSQQAYSDLSFLDDINIDEIVESLNKSPDPNTEEKNSPNRTDKSNEIINEEFLKIDEVKAPLDSGNLLNNLLLKEASLLDNLRQVHQEIETEKNSMENSLPKEKVLSFEEKENNYLNDLPKPIDERSSNEKDKSVVENNEGSSVTFYQQNTEEKSHILAPISTLLECIQPKHGTKNQLEEPVKVHSGDVIVKDINKQSVIPIILDNKLNPMKETNISDKGSNIQSIIDLSNDVSNGHDITEQCELKKIIRRKQRRDSVRNGMLNNIKMPYSRRCVIDTIDLTKDEKKNKGKRLNTTNSFADEIILVSETIINKTYTTEVNKEFQIKETMQTTNKLGNNDSIFLKKTIETFNNKVVVKINENAKEELVANANKEKSININTNVIDEDTLKIQTIKPQSYINTKPETGRSKPIAKDSSNISQVTKEDRSVMLSESLTYSDIEKVKNNSHSSVNKLNVIEKTEENNTSLLNSSNSIIAKEVSNVQVVSPFNPKDDIDKSLSISSIPENVTGDTQKKENNVRCYNHNSIIQIFNEKDQDHTQINSTKNETNTNVQKSSLEYTESSAIQKHIQTKIDSTNTKIIPSLTSKLNNLPSSTQKKNEIFEKTVGSVLIVDENKIKKDEIYERTTIVSAKFKNDKIKKIGSNADTVGSVMVEDVNKKKDEVNVKRIDGVELRNDNKIKEDEIQDKISCEYCGNNSKMKKDEITEKAIDIVMIGNENKMKKDESNEREIDIVMIRNDNKMKDDESNEKAIDIVMIDDNKLKKDESNEKAIDIVMIGNDNKMKKDESNEKAIDIVMIGNDNKIKHDESNENATNIVMIGNDNQMMNDETNEKIVNSVKIGNDNKTKIDENREKTVGCCVSTGDENKTNKDSINEKIIVSVKSEGENKKFTSNITGKIKAIAGKLKREICQTYNENFTVTDLIHSGTYSKIFRCRNNKVGRDYAVKSLNCSLSVFKNADQCAKLFSLQRGMMRHMYPCVFLLNSFPINSHLCYIMDYYPKTLKQALAENAKPFHINLVQHLSRQLVSAVMLLKKHDMVHLDIKPSHILLNHTNTQLKLGGFDIVRDVNRIPLHFDTGTVNYRAPEIIMGYKLGFDVDTWATGLVFYEMATNIQLFPGVQNNDILYKQMCTLGPLPIEMIHRSRFAHKHFTGSNFKRVMGNPRNINIITKFHRSGRMESTLSKAYNVYWRSKASRQGLVADVDKVTLLIELLREILQVDPTDRMPIQFVNMHPFLRNFNDDNYSF